MTNQTTFDRLDQPRLPKPRPKPGDAAHLRERLEEILDLYIAGYSLASACEKLQLGVKPAALRKWLGMPDQIEAYQAAREERVHGMVERNLELAETVVSVEPKLAADTRFKVAALAMPDQYSEKRVVELTGKGGAALQVKADLTLSPAEAYERLIGGKA